MDTQMYRRADDILLGDMDTLARERGQLQAQLDAAPAVESWCDLIVDLAGTFRQMVETAAPAEGCSPGCCISSTSARSR